MYRTMLVLAVMLGLQLSAYAASADNASCSSECIKCALACNSTLKHCRTLGGDHATAEHTIAIQDCASLCRQSANFINRGSTLASKLCALCAEACERCAQSCETFKDDEAMQACAKECRDCEQACRKMAG